MAVFVSYSIFLHHELHDFTFIMLSFEERIFFLFLSNQFLKFSFKDSAFLSELMCAAVFTVFLELRGRLFPRKMSTLDPLKPVNGALFVKGVLGCG